MTDTTAERLFLFWKCENSWSIETSHVAVDGENFEWSILSVTRNYLLFLRKVLSSPFALFSRTLTKKKIKFYQNSGCKNFYPWKSVKAPERKSRAIISTISQKGTSIITWAAIFRVRRQRMTSDNCDVFRLNWTKTQIFSQTSAHSPIKTTLMFVIIYQSRNKVWFNERLHF